MERLMRPAAIALAIVSLLLIRCTTPEPPQVPVSIYGRNAAPVAAWFATQPVDPLANVGFGRDLGVACWRVAAGSQVVMLDHSPSLGPANVVRVVTTVAVQPSSARQEVWVDVAADGTVDAGTGVPSWWTGGPGC
jgi:hypothetical protein